MIERIISGGQTGADQAALRAARAAGISTGGWMPKGFRTEDGPRPEFAELYGMVEMGTIDYRPRTEQNIRDSQATLWFGSTHSAGFKVTSNACGGVGRALMVVSTRRGTKPSDVAAWTVARRVKVLNVAGNRESKAPGIGAKVERFLADVFARLR